MQKHPPHSQRLLAFPIILIIAPVFILAILLALTAGAAPVPSPNNQNASTTAGPVQSCGHIDIPDAVAVLQHFYGTAAPLTGCALIAADATGDGVVINNDAIAIQRFYAGFTSGVGSNTGTDTGCGLCYGDTTSSTNSPLPGVTVSLPTTSLDASVDISTVIILPVVTTDIEAGMGLVGFQGALTFDERVVTFNAGQPIAKAGVTSANGWTIVGHILQGIGPFRTLRVSAWYPDGVTPISGSGTLFNLRMLRVSSTSGEMSNLAWTGSPDDFEFVNSSRNTVSPFQGNGLITITGPTPTPPSSVVISGRVGNCASPAPTATPPASPPPPTLPGAPNVLMTLTGSSTATTLTDASGNYSFTVPAGGSYVVTPSKSPLPGGSSGIITTDILAVQRHYLGIVSIPVGCRLSAGDVVPNSVVNGADVVAMQRFFNGYTTNIGSCGEYRFAPTGQSYSLITTDQTGQDYAVYVLGDVTPPFVNQPDDESSEIPEEAKATNSHAISVWLPEIITNQSRANFTVPIISSIIDARENLVGFQGDFTFDERVLAFAREPVQAAGLTATNWNIAGNVLPGKGPIRTLRLSGYSTNFAPLNGVGTLLNLNVAHVNPAAGRSPLIWAAPPNNFIFVNSHLESQSPNNVPPPNAGPS